MTKTSLRRCVSRVISSHYSCFCVAFLNKDIGYNPLNFAPRPVWDETGSGYLEVPEDHVYTDIEPRFIIGFDELLQGLDKAWHLDGWGGTYDLENNNCVDAVIDAGEAVGVELPDGFGRWPGGKGSNPSDFKKELEKKYPNWIDEPIEQ